MPEPDWHSRCNEELTELRDLVRELAGALRNLHQLIESGILMRNTMHDAHLHLPSSYLAAATLGKMNMLLTDPRVRTVVEP